MRYDGTNLGQVLSAHRHWVKFHASDPHNGKTNYLPEYKADFSSTTLRDVDLSGAVLEGADFTGADLTGANFSEAKLTDANFSFAYLSHANFTGANAAHAYLYNTLLDSAILDDAVFDNAELSHSILTHASLVRTNLTYARLMGVNFTDADLTKACLVGANITAGLFYRTKMLDTKLGGSILTRSRIVDSVMTGSNWERALIDAVELENTIDIPDYPMVCPASGGFTGWKQAMRDRREIGRSIDDFVIVELYIPEDAKRSSGISRKCRCSKAIVKSIQSLDGKILDINHVYSRYDPNFVYKVGQCVEPLEPFNEDRWQECASGIHFFISRKEAEDY